MGFADILLSAKAALAKIQAGELVAGGREIIKVESSLLDIAADLGFKSTAEDAKCIAETEAVLKCCHAEVEKCCGNCDGVGSQAVGRLGDGVLLKILLDAALKLLPLFI
jgi:hypothetical protein